MVSDLTSWTIVSVTINFPGTTLIFSATPFLNGGCSSQDSFTLPTTSSVFPAGYTITLGGQISLVLADVRLIDDDNLANLADFMICVWEEACKNFSYLSANAG